jgi:AhpD family alkylhydroperoxidase
MVETLYPPSSRELAEKRRTLAPDTEKAFHAFSKQVFAEGALPAKTKQLIAVAVAHVTQCPYCIRGHTKAALRHGATREELMEAIWVAAEMRLRALRDRARRDGRSGTAGQEYMTALGAIWPEGVGCGRG